MADLRPQGPPLAHKMTPAADLLLCCGSQACASSCDVPACELHVLGILEWNATV